MPFLTNHSGDSTPARQVAKPKSRSWPVQRLRFRKSSKTFDEVVLKEFGPDLFPGYAAGKAVREGIQRNV